MKSSIAIGLSLVFLSFNTQAITINSFSDWGISSSGVTSSVSGVYSQTEDQTQNFLDPGYGGQAYDAEGIYATWDASYLYVGVMTGRAPNASGWSAGDIAFDFGSDSSYEFGLITTDSAGSYPAAAGIGSPGQLFSVTEWNLGLWDSNGGYIGSTGNTADPDHPTSVAAGNEVLNAVNSFSYQAIGSSSEYGAGGQSYFISAAIDLNAFGGAAFLDDGLSLHWAATCNNDWIMLDLPTQSVPEPATLGLFSLSLLGLLATRRRKA